MKNNKFLYTKSLKFLIKLLIISISFMQNLWFGAFAQEYSTIEFCHIINFNNADRQIIKTSGYTNDPINDKGQNTCRQKYNDPNAVVYRVFPLGVDIGTIATNREYYCFFKDINNTNNVVEMGGISADVIYNTTPIYQWTFKQPFPSWGPICDSDQDNIRNETDNCPNISNPDQVDIDQDGIGDVCDSFIDSDGDGIANSVDNCPITSNPDQADNDNNGVGDLCDNVCNANGILEANLGEECDLGALNSNDPANNHGCSLQCKKIIGWNCSQTQQEYDQYVNTIIQQYTDLVDMQVNFDNNNCSDFTISQNDQFCINYKNKLNSFKLHNDLSKVDCTGKLTTLKQSPATIGEIAVEYQVSCK